MPYSVSPRRIDHRRGPKPTKYSVTFIPAPLGRDEVAELVEHTMTMITSEDEQHGLAEHRRREAEATMAATTTTRRTRPGRGASAAARAAGRPAEPGGASATSRCWPTGRSAPACPPARAGWRSRRLPACDRRLGLGPGGRSASSTASTDVASASSERRTRRVSATTSAMPTQRMRPSRKAATATSLAALSQAGRRPPARPAW